MAYVFPAGSSATLANTDTTASITLSVTSIGGVSRSIAMADISALTDTTLVKLPARIDPGQVTVD